MSGIVLVRQRPSTANGILFCTIEDESAAAKLIVRPAVFEKYRRAARGAAAIVAHRRIKRQGAVAHLLVERIEDVAEELASFASRSRDFH